MQLAASPYSAATYAYSNPQPTAPGKYFLSIFLHIFVCGYYAFVQVGLLVNCDGDSIFTTHFVFIHKNKTICVCLYVRTINQRHAHLTRHSMCLPSDLQTIFSAGYRVVQQPNGAWGGVPSGMLGIPNGSSPQQQQPQMMYTTAMPQYQAQ